MKNYKMDPARMTAPLTPAERVNRAQARQLNDGWRRVNLRLPPEAAKLLADAEARHGNATAAIVAALKQSRKSSD